MSQPTSNPTRHTVARTKASPCIDRECTSGRRNRFYLGKRLTADSLQVEQDYLVERRRLLNRAVHGYGVVYGYAVSGHDASAHPSTVPEGLLDVGPGLALDAHGRELLQVEPLPLALADVTLLDDDDQPVSDPGAVFASAYPASEGQSPEPQAQAGTPSQTQTATPQQARTEPGKHGDGTPEVCWLLSVHYAEEDIGPVTLHDPCSCERHGWEQVCETVRYSLRRIDCAKCCREAHCDLHCRCATGRCCHPYLAEPDEPPHWRRIPRGGCRCLCEHLTRLHPDAECTTLRAGKDGVRVAWHNGIALACVSLRSDDCGGFEFDAVVEDCGPRRLVKRNDLLFDLIRGCDLTHIRTISWRDWHRTPHRVKWDDFAACFPKDPTDKARECITNFWIVFSRPVRKDTLAPEAFAMTVMIGEYEGGWGNVLRVPIVRIDHNQHDGDPPEYAGAVDASDGPEYTRRARIVVDGAWTSDAVHGRKTQFDHHGTSIEIEVRGDYILDCNGQPVDANAHGRVPAPSGNGTPGGTYLSTFRLHAKP